MKRIVMKGVSNSNPKPPGPLMKRIVRSGLKSHYFHIIGDINQTVGVYKAPL